MLEKIDLEKIVDIAKEAGEVIMKIYSRDFKIEYKDDKSPLTEADIKSNNIICNALTLLYPDIPILSEENATVDYKTRKNWKYYWCIDPIDGTKEFIKRNGEFTVNIALIQIDKPVLGVVYAPAIDVMYKAKDGIGAFKNDIKLPMKINNNLKDKTVVVCSKSHLSKETQEFIDNIDTKEIIQKSIGSSLKLCMVAEGEADIYPRVAPTMEWDTAAAHAIVLNSKKDVVRFDDKKSLVYNKENLLNPSFIVR
jgi:3'(2'), 5'-bisphosphate nucleotidase